jgi:HK97 family phage portal protein
MLGFMRKSATYSLTTLASMMPGWIGWGTSSGKSVTVNTAIDVTAVFCAARVIAEGLAQMPVRIISTARDGSGRKMWQEDESHWAYKVLAVRPNSWQTSYEFREGMIFNAALAGGAIAIKNVIRGEVRELLPVPSGSWSVEQGQDWSLNIRVTYLDKTFGIFPLSQVFYLRGPSLDGYQGLSAVRAAREAIGLSMALEAQQAKLAGAGGKPSGVLAFPNKLSPDAKENLRATWQARFGTNGEGGVAIVDSDAKFHSMTMTSVDAQYIETRRMQIEEIGRAFRVQPIMLMQADKAATFASAEQMFRMHVIHTLGPWIERFEQAANRDILNNVPGLTVDLDERNLLRGDFKDQAEYYTKALGAGGQAAWMSQNEIRAEVGLNPIKEAWADGVSQGVMGAKDGTQAPSA